MERIRFEVRKLTAGVSLIPKYKTFPLTTRAFKACMISGMLVV